MQPSFFMRWLLGLCFYLVSCPLVVAQLSTSAALDNNNLLIGDQVVLRLQALAANDEVVKDADISPLEKLEAIEILEVSDWDTLQSTKGVFLQKDITITSFDSGYYYIPQLAITYETNGQTQQSLTPQLALAVNTLPADSLELAPIKEIIEAPLRLEDILPIIGGIVALLALIFGGLYLWRRRSRTTTEIIETPEIKRPAHEIAFEQLETLQGKGLWQNGNVKAYHSELTYIVREYLENRYDVQALESTTDEILRGLAAIGFDRNWKTKLREMLQAADLVKFAKAEPPAEFHERMLTYAKDFVHATKQFPKEDLKEDE